MHLRYLFSRTQIQHTDTPIENHDEFCSSFNKNKKSNKLLILRTSNTVKRNYRFTSNVHSFGIHVSIEQIFLSIFRTFQCSYESRFLLIIFRCNFIFSDKFRSAVNFGFYPKLFSCDSFAG